jgi:hypothetical protein
MENALLVTFWVFLSYILRVSIWDYLYYEVYFHRFTTVLTYVFLKIHLKIVLTKINILLNM